MPVLIAKSRNKSPSLKILLALLNYFFCPSFVLCCMRNFSFGGIIFQYDPAHYFMVVQVGRTYTTLFIPFLYHSSEFSCCYCCQATTMLGSDILCIHLFTSWFYYWFKWNIILLSCCIDLEFRIKSMFCNALWLPILLPIEVLYEMTVE